MVSDFYFVELLVMILCTADWMEQVVQTRRHCHIVILTWSIVNRRWRGLTFFLLQTNCLQSCAEQEVKESEFSKVWDTYSSQELALLLYFLSLLWSQTLKLSQAGHAKLWTAFCQYSPQPFLQWSKGNWDLRRNKAWFFRVFFHSEIKHTDVTVICLSGKELGRDVYSEVVLVREVPF